MSGYTIFRNTVIILGTLGLAYLFLISLNIWIVLFVAILIASAIRPLIIRIKRTGIPEGAAILLVYAAFFLSSSLILVTVLPPVVNQFVTYIQDENRLATRIVLAQYWVERTLSDVTASDVEIGVAREEIQVAVSDLVETFRVTAPNLIDDAVGFIADAILIFVMGAYWITSRQQAEDFVVGLMPISRQPRIRAIMQEIEFGLGSYLRGLALISLIVSILCFLTLFVLRVPNAATLAFIYGIATAVPIIGGLVGVLSCTVIALLSSPTSALLVLVVTVVLQQIENYFLSPRILSQSTEFNEILVIVFIAIGFSLNGITGALIAVPIAGTVSILVKHLIIEPRRQEIVPERVRGGIVIAGSEDTNPASK